MSISPSLKTTSAQDTVEIATTCVLNAGVTALAAYALTSINPLAGAIFGAASSFGSHMVKAVLDSMNCCGDSSLSKAASAAARLLGSIGLGILVTSLMGFPLTFTAALILIGASIVSLFALILITEGCIIIGSSYQAGSYHSR